MQTTQTPTQRTGGMLALGICNTLFGSLGSVLFLLLILGGGIFAAVGAGMGTESAEASEAGSALAAGGGMLMLIGAAGALAWATIAIGGIGTILVKPWARKLCMFGGVAIAVLSLVGIVMNGFTVGGALGTGYGALQVFLFMTPQWTEAFSGTTSSEFTTTTTTTNEDEFRRAA